MKTQKFTRMRAQKYTGTRHKITRMRVKLTTMRAQKYKDEGTKIYKDEGTKIRG